MVTQKLTDILMEYRLRSVSKVRAGWSDVIIFLVLAMRISSAVIQKMYSICFCQQDSSLTNLSMGSNNFTPAPSRLPSVNNHWSSSLQGTYGRSLWWCITSETLQNHKPLCSSIHLESKGNLSEVSLEIIVHWKKSFHLSSCRSIQILQMTTERPCFSSSQLHIFLIVINVFFLQLKKNGP